MRILLAILIMFSVGCSTTKKRKKKEKQPITIMLYVIPLPPDLGYVSPEGL